MIIPDINVLVYAYDSESSRHEAAREWWETTLSLSRPVGLSWITITGFIRIMTHARILRNPMYPSDAIRRVRAWLARPRLQIVTPGDAHGEIFFGLLEQLGSAGNLTTDAHLAALALEYQAEIATTDTDFARFPKLRWFDPTHPR